MDTKIQPPLFSDGGYTIRAANTKEETRSIWWTFMQILGWNRGWYDLSTYTDHSRSSGMLLVFTARSTEPVGHVAAVVNTNSTDWVSMSIVDPAYQGLGLGRGLFDAAMRDFVKCGTAVVGLDGVAEQKATYERRGLVESDLGVVRLMSRPLVAKERLEGFAVEVANIVWLTDIRNVRKELLVEYEYLYTGFKRRDLWTDRNVFDRLDVREFALVDQEHPHAIENIYAWTLVRRCSDGARIGPVYARDANAAKLALAEMMKTVILDYIRAVPMEGEAMNSWSDEEVVERANLVAEIWTGNSASLPLFESLGWIAAGLEYHQMWLDGKATEAQSEGGLAQAGLLAIFDAAVG